MLYQNMTEQQQKEMIQLNEKFETDSIRDGIERYRRTMLALDSASKRPEKVVMGRFLEAVAGEIAQEQRYIANSRLVTGGPSAWWAPFISIKADKLAMIAMSYMFQSPKQVSSVLCREIGTAVMNEIMLAEIKEINKQKNPNQKGFSRDDTKKFVRNLPKIQKVFKQLTGNSLRWKLSFKIGLGAKLIECVMEATQGWVLQTEWIQKNISKNYIVMVDELTEFLNTYHINLEANRPVKQPMCVPPLPWKFVDEHGMESKESTSKIEGGYRILKEEFITGRKGHHNADLKNYSVNQVMEACNHMQATQWKIDTDILQLAKHIMDLNSHEYSNIIPCAPVKPKLPPLPEDKVGRRLWFQNRQQLRSRWYADTSKRISAIKALDTADTFKDLPVFFPWEVDFRGRFYPKASHISPQGNDLCRALLRYEERKELGDSGLNALIIYAVGLAGHDKMQYPERIKWFEANWIPYIKGKSKFDPFSHKVWVDYDSPMQFMQVLWEIQLAVNSKDPNKFKSSVNCSIDATQSGIQHLSAVMRDEVGGRSVNLIDSVDPQDLYLDVADKVKATIYSDYKADPVATDALGNPAPHVLWYKYITEGDENMQRKRRRKLVKRCTMAYPYGITLRGMHDNIIADGFCDNLPGSIYHNANYLANITNEAVEDTVIQASVLMKYLREIARILGENNFPVTWVTPLGLPVLQQYLHEESRIVKTCLHHTQFFIPNGIKELDVGAQVRGIVANWIHSLDASHAGYCALDMKDEGITSVCFIHDSIGTHAANMEILHKIIRKSFINMHDIPLLEDFISKLERNTGIKLPPIPKKGSLKLEAIRNSRWFFS